MVFQLDELLSINFFSELDRQFARFILRLSNSDSFDITLAALLVSNMTGRGNICLDIPLIAGKHIDDIPGKDEKIESKIMLPSEEKWIDALRHSIVVGRPYDYKPLILDDKGRLYLYRYWDYERFISDNIKERLIQDSSNVDYMLLSNGLDRLFPRSINDSPNWQRIAAFASVVRRFCVISGGPGTGKTSTVVKILALLLEQSSVLPDKPSIACAAPTGKAAARLKESIKQSCDSLNCSDDILCNIPEDTYTIHRLLGAIPGAPYFRYNANNPLPNDIVLVDESSMVDLALMSKLFQAVPLKSHLILLGDKDQLSSVEAGAVLGDICNTGNTHGFSTSFVAKVREVTGEELSCSGTRAGGPPVSDSLQVLHKSYRFMANSGIDAVSRAIRGGDSGLAVELLRQGGFSDIKIVDINASCSLSAILSGHVEKGYKSYLKEDSPEKAYSLFSRFTILCALRKGPFGVERINEIVEKILEEKGLIEPVNNWYNGRPVMVTRNDYGLRVFNGDVGLILPDRLENDKPRFFLPAYDGKIRKIPPFRLPEHVTVYAMTVHKSQGSEFDDVILLLPDRMNNVLTRELLYTAITRARKGVEIWGSDKIIVDMINNPTRRTSGLRDALWVGNRS